MVSSMEPVLRIFRTACLYSEYKCVMDFFEKMNDLEGYARIRGTDAETLRDTALSAVDLDENGCHTYDLGNQTVTARLTAECTLVFEASDGIILKSLPKKGSDEKMYKKAKAECSNLINDVNKVIKKRFDLIFSDFLSGSGKDAKSWLTVYTENIALKQVAKLIVWQQGDKTFILSDNGMIDSRGNEYILTADPVIVAHPMEMQADDLEHWQKYFYTKGLKQPFEQVWEPVHDPETEEISGDRYAGCLISYLSFVDEQKHGIYVEGEDDEDFPDSLSFDFDGLYADVYLIDFRWGTGWRFEIDNISFKNYTRQTNHIIAYFDRLTVMNRVEKDDISLVQLLPGFTLAQICDFITAAQKANAVNVLAQLLEYKNKTFPDFDLMEKFSLDW